MTDAENPFNQGKEAFCRLGDGARARASRRDDARHREIQRSDPQAAGGGPDG
ncbi:MAG: hypothetical protein ACLR6J_00455 [Parabacteroides merdae]